MKTAKKISIIILLIFLFSVSLLNIFQPNRKTISEEENRTLATFPEFSIESFLCGDYFSKIDAFISDTFIKRDELMNLAKKLCSFKSINTFIKDDDSFTYIASNGQNTNAYDNANESTDVISNDNLNTTNKNPIDAKTSYIASSSNIEHYFILNIEKSLQAQIASIAEAERLSKEIPYNAANSADTEETSEYVTGGYIVYKGIPYSVCANAIKNSPPFFEAVNSFAKVFPYAKVSVLLGPQSSLIIDNEKIQKQIINQNNYINALYMQCDKNINTVNPCINIFNHRNEDVFFKYDHHWTPLGAYYAYEDLANSLGMQAVKLEDMEKVELLKEWQGSTYRFTGDIRFKDGRDPLIMYMPKKEHIMTYMDTDGSFHTRSSILLKEINAYSALIGGDKPYTVVTVPENPADKICLVIKDSYANAVIPYLCEHYNTIVIVDPRHAKFDITEQTKNFKFSDIFFITADWEPGVLEFSKSALNLIKSAIPKE